VSRNPLGSIVGLALGIVLFGGGAILAAWAIMGMYEPDTARRWAAVAAPYAPREIAEAFEHIVSSGLQLGIAAAAAAGGILMMMGHSALGAFRVALRPLDMSDDGKARIKLANPPPRPGRPLEGSIVMNSEPSPDQVFKVHLRCARQAQSGGERELQCPFDKNLEAKPAPGAHGVYIPFRFDIPASAPASGVGFFANSGYRWRLDVTPVKRWFASTSTFDLQFEPAANPESRAFAAARPMDAESVIDGIDKLLAKRGRSLRPSDREQLRKLPPRVLALVSAVARNPSNIIIWVVVGYVVLSFVLPIVAALIGFALSALTDPS